MQQIKFRWIGILCAAACFACASAVDEPYFTCTTNADCPSDKKCVPLDYSESICKSIECKIDADCDIGEYCDVNTLQCRKFCQGYGDCLFTERCNELTLRCEEDTSLK